MSSELKWVMESPALLSREVADLVTDEECSAALSRFEPIAVPPKPRLGDYFESLVVHWHRRLLGHESCVQGVPIRQGQSRTIGELDLVFESSPGELEHWEVAVKFYMCIAPDPGRGLRLSDYVGQALRDRLDLKLAHLLDHQLPLARHPLVESALAARGLRGRIRSRLFMKGRLFYPVAWDWRGVKAPAEISKDHLRGWWMPWSAELSRKHLQLAPDGEKWAILEKPHWLGGWRPGVDLLDQRELEDRLGDHFSVSSNAVQLARIKAGVEIPGRGMILMPGWPDSVSLSNESPT